MHDVPGNLLHYSAVVWLTPHRPLHLIHWPLYCLQNRIRVKHKMNFSPTVLHRELIKYSDSVICIKKNIILFKTEMLIMDNAQSFRSPELNSKSLREQYFIIHSGMHLKVLVGSTNNDANCCKFDEISHM